MRRSMMQGLGLSFTAFSVLAMGCFARVPDDAAGEDVGEIVQAVKWNGCPNDAPIGTNNYEPPHAFPGPCRGLSSREQARWDGATQELESRCRTYCGSSLSACGASAYLDILQCVNRDVGHRWTAVCVCGGDGPGHGPGPGPGPGNGHGPGPGNGHGPGWGHDGHGPHDDSWGHSGWGNNGWGVDHGGVGSGRWGTGNGGWIGGGVGHPGYAGDVGGFSLVPDGYADGYGGYGDPAP
ncbi:ATP-dependent RNA helicase A [Minicystis rosea]|nr:ATP-dependent RNA helicase A [Minicystis rosea]